MNDLDRVVLAIMAVWTAEALNTAVAFLANAAVPQRHPLVEKRRLAPPALC